MTSYFFITGEVDCKDVPEVRAQVDLINKSAGVAIAAAAPARRGEIRVEFNGELEAGREDLVRISDLIRELSVWALRPTIVPAQTDDRDESVYVGREDFRGHAESDHVLYAIKRRFDLEKLSSRDAATLTLALRERMSMDDLLDMGRALFEQRDYLKSQVKKKTPET